MPQRKKFIKQIFLYTLLTLLSFFLIPSNANEGSFIGFSPYRLALISLCVIILVVLIILLSAFGTNNGIEKIFDYLITFFQKRKVFSVFFFFIAHLIILFGFLFFICWIIFQEYSAYFLRLTPLCFLAMATSIQSIFWDRSQYSIHLMEVKEYLLVFRTFIRNKIFSRTFFIIGAFVFGSIYLYWGINHAISVNQNPMLSDQHAYLSIAKQAYETDYRYHGDRNRMPIYPYLLSLLFKSGMSDSIFFELGKIFNVLLSFALLISLFFVLTQSLLKKQAAMMTIIVGLGLFVYKSGYVQPELLFYFLYFVSYVLMLKMLATPRINLSIITGLMLAISYLVKASVLPSLAIFLAVLSLRQVLELKDLLNHKIANHRKTILLKFVPVVLVLISFLLLLSPYLLENKKMFGKYFYNVNSTFYIWNDNWDDVMQGTKAHGDDMSWPDLPEEQIPSIQNYFEEHSIKQVIERFKLGFKNQIDNILKPYSYFNYPLIYSVVFFLFSLVNFKSTLKIAIKNKYQILFFVLVFCSSIILYAWYSPITNFHDARFIYGLYIPFIYSLFMSIKNISNQILLKNEYLHTNININHLFKVVNLIICGLLLYETIYHLPITMTTGWFAK